MIFDSLCRVIDRAGDKPHRAMVEGASLLKFPGTRTASAAEDSAAVRIPWNPVAVEDDDGVVLLARAGNAPGKIKAVDPSTTPIPIDVDRRIGTEPGILRGDVFRTLLCIRERPGTVFALDFVADEPTTHGFFILGGCVYQGRENKQVHRVAYEEMQKLDSNRTTVLQGCLQCFLVALADATRACQPSHWILREIDRVPQRQPGKKLLRSHQRDRWRVITDKQRVRYFPTHPATEPMLPGQKVSAHPRRAHYRNLGVDDQGETRFTWVRSCWVGPTETTLGGARYKVELDL